MAHRMSKVREVFYRHGWSVNYEQAKGGILDYLTVQEHRHSKGCTAHRGCRNIDVLCRH